MVSNNILSILNDGICTGCGTCISMCPENAITIRMNDKKGIYLPELSAEKCINCRVCLKVCPQGKKNIEQINSENFGKNTTEFLIGEHIDCYIGYSKNYDIRYNSSSGGSITQILISALEQGIINGALVTRMKKDEPLVAEAFIARTKNEIIEASKSKYCPVPLNLGLKEILKSNTEQKFAVVGLPCHIRGIERAKKINSELNKKIILTLGLFCNHTPNMWATKLLLLKNNIKQEDVIKLEYRSEGWPGFMKIVLGNGKILKIPQSSSWNFIGSYFFYPKGCMVCSDCTCELADISFGDGWLPEVSNNKIGISLIIARNMIATKIIENMNNKNEIVLSKITVRQVIRSKERLIYFKKYCNARRKLYNLELESINLFKPNMSDYLISFFPYLNQLVFSNVLFMKMLVYVPPKLIWAYNFPYFVINSIKSKKLKKYN